MATSRRTRVLGRLLLILGGPVAVVALLFAFGAWLGARNAATVQAFEQRWLGLAPPPAPGAALERFLERHGLERGDRASPGPAGERGPGPQAEAPTSPGTAAPASPATEPPAAPREPSEPAGDPGSAPGPERPSPAGPPGPGEGAGPGASRPDPLDDPILQALLERDRVVAVAVYVDEAWILHDSRWVTSIEALLRAASDELDAWVGVRLELRALVPWAAEVRARALEDSLSALAAADRYGADVVVGLRTTAGSGGRRGLAASSPEAGAENGDALVVVIDDGVIDPAGGSLRLVLAQLGRLFGAVEPAGAGAGRESWMAPDARGPAAPLWLDPENRAQILRNKQRPFARAAAPRSP